MRFRMFDLRAANQGDLFFTGPTRGYYERSIFSLIHPKFQNMADLEDFDSALEKALSALAGLGISLKLRSEQKEAVTTLLSREDLLAVLPTGFGKSLIFQTSDIHRIPWIKLCGCCFLIRVQVQRAVISH